VQDFRRIAAWARAHALALDVRYATRRFPRSGYADPEVAARSRRGFHRE